MYINKTEKFVWNLVELRTTHVILWSNATFSIFILLNFSFTVLQSVCDHSWCIMYNILLLENGTALLTEKKTHRKENKNNTEMIQKSFRCY